MKIVRLISLFLTLTLLASCGNTPQENGQTGVPSPEGFTYIASDDRPVEGNAVDGNALMYSDGRLYIAMIVGIGLAGEGELLTCVFRYHPENGILSSLCTDPLCFHNSVECPFFGLDAMQTYANRNRIFFKRTYFPYDEEKGYTGEVYCADVMVDAEGKLTVLRDYGELTGGYIYQIFTDEYRFYYAWIWDEENADSGYTALMRDSLTGGSTAELAQLSFLEASYIAADETKLYFTDGKRIYSTDFDYKNHTTIAEGDFADAHTYHLMKFDGSSFIYGTDWDESGSYALHSVTLDGEFYDLGIRASDFTLTENYIYYRSTEKISIGKNGVYGYIGDEVVLTGSELYRCCRDGSENELIFTFDGDLSGTRPLRFIPLGNYIYCTYTSWSDSDGDGTFEDGDNTDSFSGSTGKILRIDITTGELYEIEVSI